MTKAKPLPPVEIIRKLLDYDKTTGNFYWLCERGNGVTTGAKAGTFLKGRNIYIHLRINGNKYLAHRIAWLLSTGQDPLELQIDHIDGNGCNNAIENLRLATSGQNSRNQKRAKSNKSGYKGVWLDKRRNKWASSIVLNRKSTWLGYFCTPELAHMAYCKAAAELHCDFARGA
jgi:hypothetical protein